MLCNVFRGTQDPNARKKAQIIRMMQMMQMMQTIQISHPGTLVLTRQDHHIWPLSGWGARAPSWGAGIYAAHAIYAAPVLFAVNAIYAEGLKW